MQSDTPQHTCTRCGAPTEGKLDDIYICDNCYSIRGSCCASEFEPDEPSHGESKNPAGNNAADS